MAPEQEKAQQQAAEAQVVSQEQKKGGELLDRIISAAPEVPKSELEAQVQALVDAALVGTPTWKKSLTRTIQDRMDAIDAKVSKQLAAIMHTPEFQKLEGSWRGLRHLVFESETGPTLKIHVLNITKDELAKDLESAVEFDQSQIFKKVYTGTFDMFGAAPYGALIGDYEFTRHPDDIHLLGEMSHLAAAAYCPFISASSPALFGLKDFTRLPKPRDLKTLFDRVEYTQWNAFRNSEDSRFVALTMPRVLARLPYGKERKKVAEFGFEEVPIDAKGRASEVPHDEFCWMNAAYVMGSRLTKSFASWGWCTSIRGVENGGKVEGLPLFNFLNDDGDTEIQCPTEVAIWERREKELSDLGFLSLCHFKNTDYSVFIGGQTLQKPKNYGPLARAANDNAEISARLPYIFAISRIAHYLKAIARDKIGAFMEADECQTWLTNWIANYRSADPHPSEEVKRRFPLADAKIEVVGEGPGRYRAKFWLRPWLMMEELNASVSLVANMADLPGKK